MAIQAGETTFYQAQRGIVQDGLVLNLDAGVRDSYDGGSTWRDLKGGNDGTMINGPLQSKVAGGTASFDGVDEYVQFGEIQDLDGCTKFSVCAWVNYKRAYGLGTNWPVQIFHLDNVFQFNLSSFVAKDAYSVGNPATDVTKLSISIRSYNNGAWTTLDSNRVVASNSWNYLVMTYDASDAIRSYINSQANTALTSSIPSSTSSTVWGSSSNASVKSTDGSIYTQYGGEGDIACINIYNRALTATEVLQNYNATRHRFGV